MFVRWFLYLLPSVMVELICYVLAPIVAFFIRKEERTDRVKQIDNQQHTMMRDYLWKPLMWFQTHDNAVDEWWYGAFNRKSYFKFAREATQETYDNSYWFRYFCRVMWLWRNVGYGFLYNLFGMERQEVPSKIIEKGSEEGNFWYKLEIFDKYFKLEGKLQLPFVNKHLTTNIGWKSHDTFPRVLYANRLISIRTNKS